MIGRILAADVGSTTTKAVLFEKRAEGWVLAGKTIAPTTVEAPDQDVMIGLRNALSKLESRTGVKLLEGARLVRPAKGNEGTDLFVATSSAGGGLQMLVTGVVKTMTAESAHRAALGAGAIVTDIVSVDDQKTLVERLEAIKNLRPDMILLTGGTDGGNVSDVLAIAEYVAMANPEPRFGKDFKIPVIYAGNVDARSLISGVVGGEMDLTYTDNIRPVLETEVLSPARNEIHRLFLEHVMMHAPGYKTLLSWADGAVKPTPVAVGDALQRIAGDRGQDVLGVDIGGATTDVFSVIDRKFYRTVSANLGMSYSMANVLSEARVESIMRWIPWEADENLLRNWSFNKMVRPTTLPETLEDLILEQSVAKEALRLSLEHHRALIRGLKGVKQKREVGDIFNQTGTGQTLVDLMKTGTIVGSGGALSYAPRPSQAAMMLLDAFQPEGVTDLVVDRQFLLPHIGVLLDREADAASDILAGESVAPLGTAICPVGPAVAPGTIIAKVQAGGDAWDVVAGEIRVIPVSAGTEAEVLPKKEFDVGKGRGAVAKIILSGGSVGLMLDGRGRPLEPPKGQSERIAALRRWYRAMSVYPEQGVPAMAAAGR